MAIPSKRTSEIGARICFVSRMLRLGLLPESRWRARTTSVAAVCSRAKEVSPAPREAVGTEPFGAAPERWPRFRNLPPPFATRLRLGRLYGCFDKPSSGEAPETGEGDVTRCRWRACNGLLGGPA